MKLLAVLQGLLIGLAAVLTVPGPASPSPGDQRTIQGVVEWTPGPGGPGFVIVRTDDGQHVYADISTTQMPPPALNLSDRVAISGLEGVSPHEVVARTVTSLGAAPAAPVAGRPGPPAAGMPSARPTPPAPGPPTVVAPAPPQPPEPSPDQVQGRVRSVSGTCVVLRTADGHDISIEMPTAGIVRTLHPGDDITVFGRREGGRFVAIGFVRDDSPTGSALPRQTR